MKAEIDMKKEAKNFTMIVNIKNLKKWKFRTKIGIILIKLAASIMWMNVELKNEH